MSNSQPLVSVVVLNLNGRDVNEACLESLRRSDYRSLRVAVVDNASTDGSPDWIASHYPGVTLLRNKANLGWSGANNVGIRDALHAGADWVWILNNDVEVEPDCISRLMAFAEKNPRVQILSPAIYYFDNRNLAWYVGGKTDFGSFGTDHTATMEEFRSLPQEQRYISGCAMLVKREVFDRIGLIDERFFIYFEDTDFCLRAAKAGTNMDVVPDARMYHKVSSFSGGTNVVSPWKAYYSLRSGLLFWKKHLGWARFHAGYCRSQLGRWVLSPHFAEDQANPASWGNVVIDALWYVVRGLDKPLERPHAPAWFRRTMQRRPWLVPELMALRWPLRKTA